MDTKIKTLTPREGVFNVTFDVYPADDV